jgi:hypothetical protein
MKTIKTLHKYSVNSKSGSVKTLNRIMYFILGLIIILSVGAILALNIKGKADIKYFGKSLSTEVEGPFESSNSNGRYALTKSIVDNKSFFYTLDLAKFSAPDVVSFKGKYFSIFTPGVSFLTIPFYLLGKPYGLEQITAYMVNYFFAILDFILIALLVKKLTNKLLPGLISGFVFLFATNAIAYTSTLSQHLITTFFLLMSYYNALYFRGWATYLIAGLLYSASILVDIPNIFALFPPTAYVFFNSFSISKIKNVYKIGLNLKVIILALSFIPLILLFGYYNQVTSGSPYKLAQIIGRTEVINPEVQTLTKNDNSSKEDNKVKEYKISFPFSSRSLINGLYIILISDERGYFYYYPILLISLIGIIAGVKNKQINNQIILLLISVVLIITMYAMFWDPWGGWSFGARYMIPVNAVLSVFLGLSVAKFAKNLLYIIVFFTLLTASFYINNIGSLTTSAVPSKGEALALPDPVPYTVDYNLRYVDQNRSGSYVYNAYLSNKLSLKNVIYYLTAFELMIILFIFSGYYLESKKYEEKNK